MRVGVKMNFSFFLLNLFPHSLVGRDSLHPSSEGGMVGYFFQASMMPLKSAAFSEAPPIRPPSMSGLAKSSRALLGLQLPP